MILYFTLFLGLIEVTAGQNATPCPGLFSYEPREKDSDRWYGEIIYSVAGNLTGVWLHVILDKPADILGVRFPTVLVYYFLLIEYKLSVNINYFHLN